MKSYRKICEFTVLGEPMSKGNGQKIGFNRKTKKPIFFGRSKKLLAYEENFTNQITALNLIPVKGPVKLTITYWFGTRRVKDLSNAPKSHCDLMIGHVFEDDNQVCEMEMFKYYDSKNPRVHILAEEIIDDPQVIKRTYPLNLEYNSHTATSNKDKKQSNKRRKKTTTKASTIKSSTAPGGDVYKNPKGKKITSSTRVAGKKTNPQPSTTSKKKTI